MEQGDFRAQKKRFGKEMVGCENEREQTGGGTRMGGKREVAGVAESL